MWNIRLIILLNLIFVVFNLNVTQAGISDYLHGNSQQNGPAAPVSFTTEQLTQAVSYAQESLERLKGLERSITNSKVKISNNTSSYAQLLENLPNDHTKDTDKTAQIILKASKYLTNHNCKRLRHDQEKQCLTLISSYQLPQGDLLNQCHQIQADNTFESTIYRRLLPANYSDGLHNINEKLPPPKNVSDIFYEETRPELELVNTDLATFEGLLDIERNIAVVQWSQFIEHDLVKTVFQTMSNDNPIECCTEDATLPAPRYRHPACAPLNIDVPTEDYNRLPSCLNYVRSALGMNDDCRFGPAQQLNQASHLLDLSQLYGVSAEEKNNLRSFKNGELKISNDPSQPTLPLNESDESDFNLCMHNTTWDGVCYQAGDSRVNMNPYMTTLYTIFLRSHNLLAKKIHRVKTAWKDERIFQMAHRINTAIYQKIVYTEWLNVVLGEQRAYAINKEEFPTTPSKIDEGVTNEFATAAIRFYYSMMPGDLRTTRDVQYFVRQSNIVIRPLTERNILKLKDEYYKPRDLNENDDMENIIHAILTQNAMAMDSGYVADVVKHFYRFQNAEQKTVGTDVLALDILRGRDHGLNGYIKYLELCTNDTVHNWNDLKRYISNQDLNRIQTVYRTIDDIDLIIGAIAERPNPGATVGPTLTCIIGEQMSRTRRTDPFFYTLTNDPLIRDNVDSYTGAKLICDTTKLTSVPRNIFRVPSESNPLVSCGSL